MVGSSAPNQDRNAEKGGIIETQEDVTPVVLAAMAGASNPRLREVAESFVRHMHAFAREVNLTESEYDIGIDFLNRIGQATNDHHNEGILFADAIGFSTLVCLLNNGNAGATETASALLGPFWRMNSPRTPNGGSIVTLTFGGSTRVMPNYNVMGVAKAALEASTRYLAADFGRNGIRVNAISAGPVRTLAGSGIGDSRAMFAFQQKHSPLGRGVTLDELGGTALYLLSDLSGGVTGEIHFVDSGYNIISMPHPDALKAEDKAD